MNKYEKFTVSRLQCIARTIGIKCWYKMRKRELIYFIMNRKDYPLDRVLSRDFFPFMFGMSYEALHDIALDSWIYGLSDARRVGLITAFDERERFLDPFFNKRGVRNVLRRLLFPDMLRAWVGLFVSNRSVAEHYVQIILRVLYPTNCFRSVRRGRKR